MLNFDLRRAWESSKQTFSVMETLSDDLLLKPLQVVYDSIKIII